MKSNRPYSIIDGHLQNPEELLQDIRHLIDDIKNTENKYNAIDDSISLLSLSLLGVVSFGLELISSGKIPETADYGFNPEDLNIVVSKLHNSLREQMDSLYEYKRMSILFAGLLYFGCNHNQALLATADLFGVAKNTVKKARKHYNIEKELDTFLTDMAHRVTLALLLRKFYKEKIAIRRTRKKAIEAFEKLAEYTEGLEEYQFQLQREKTGQT